MHYYKRNIGDYHKKAGRLSMLEHGAYTLLIDACYDREQFPTKQQAIDWCWARTADEVAAVEFVLSKFFTEIDGQYVQGRIAEELAHYHNNSLQNQRIAKQREEIRRQKKATEKHEACTDEHEACTERHLTINQEPLTINQEPNITTLPAVVKTEKSKTITVSMLVEKGIDHQVAADWITHRKAKRSPVTPTVIKSLAVEAAKASLTLEQAMAIQCIRGWQGFKADWVIKERNEGKLNSFSQVIENPDYWDF